MSLIHVLSTLLPTSYQRGKSCPSYMSSPPPCRPLIKEGSHVPHTCPLHTPADLSSKREVMSLTPRPLHTHASLSSRWEVLSLIHVLSTLLPTSYQRGKSCPSLPALSTPMPASHQRGKSCPSYMSSLHSCPPLIKEGSHVPHSLPSPHPCQPLIKEGSPVPHTCPLYTPAHLSSKREVLSLIHVLSTPLPAVVSQTGSGRFPVVNKEARRSGVGVSTRLWFL